MLEFRNVSVIRKGKTVLDKVSFVLPENKLTILLGKNGSGKTTLLRCLNGTVPYTGEIRCNGTELKALKRTERARILSMLPQSLPETGMTVMQIMQMGRSACLPVNKALKDEDRAVLLQILRKVGLEAYRDVPCNSLSGGERQRAFLAMTLARDTDILLMDEPTSSLDRSAVAEVLRIMEGLRGEKTILTVTHQLNDLLHCADHVLMLDGGRIVFDGSLKECCEDQMPQKVLDVQSLDHIRQTDIPYYV